MLTAIQYDTIMLLFGGSKERVGKKWDYNSYNKIGHSLSTFAVDKKVAAKWIHPFLPTIYDFSFRIEAKQAKNKESYCLEGCSVLQRVISTVLGNSGKCMWDTHQSRIYALFFSMFM